MKTNLCGRFGMEGLKYPFKNTFGYRGMLALLRRSTFRNLVSLQGVINSSETISHAKRMCSVK